MRVWASAPGKIILVGEHAVVYGQPAIALPVTQVKAEVMAQAGRPNTGIIINAADIRREYMVGGAHPDEPLAFTCRTLLTKLGIKRMPDVLLTLRSDIPIASGLGSGAATATAMAKALARWLGWELSPAQLSAIVYETEKIHHGTPSGIDNTVIAHEKPVWFVRGDPVQTFSVKGDFTFLVANTGIHSPTRITVGDVRKRWEAEPERYNLLFDQVGTLVRSARQALEQGDTPLLGTLMNQNHTFLQEMGVSALANDKLAEAALAAGAVGAKVSGGGRGGNNIILVPLSKIVGVKYALLEAGAVRVMQTGLKG
jgi:mevalonate kinase